MLNHNIVSPDIQTDREDMLVFLPGYRQSLADVEQLVSQICRDMVRVIVEPPLSTSLGKFSWAKFDPNVRPLKFNAEQIQAGVDAVVELVQATKLANNASRVYLAGFSQGGVVAAHTVDQYPSSFAGMVASHLVLVPELLARSNIAVSPPIHAIFSEPGIDGMVTDDDRQRVLGWLVQKDMPEYARTDLPIKHEFNLPVVQTIQGVVQRWQRINKTNS